jgi:hypothetical protein
VNLACQNPGGMRWCRRLVADKINPNIAAAGHRDLAFLFDGLAFRRPAGDDVVEMLLAALEWRTYEHALGPLFGGGMVSKVMAASAGTTIVIVAGFAASSARAGYWKESRNPVVPM